MTAHRIAQVANFVAPHSGGIRTVLDHLAAGYARHGHEVVQIVPGVADRTVETAWGRRIVLAGWAVPRTGYRLLHPDAVTRALAAARPDRLEVHDRTTLRRLGTWARLNGVRSAVFSHERLDRVLVEWLPRGLPVRAIADRSNAALAELYDTVVCTTRWAAEEFVRLDCAAPRVVPLGVDAERFTPSAADPVLRGRIVDDRTALLVLASRLSREKHPEIALRAGAELARRGIRAELVVAGDGPLRGRLRRQTTANGWPVRFVGFLPQPDVARWLACADVVLAPGPVETFCLAALEALACGTPVVANASSAVGEILGDAGLTATGDAGEFADAIEAVLRRPAGIRRAAARGRALGYRWQDTVRALLEVHQLPAADALDAVEIA